MFVCSATVRRGCATLALCITMTSAASAARWHVDATLTTGADTGTTWSDAFQGPLGLQSALALAQPGDEIWVAAGTYVAALAGDRSTSFDPPANVSLYGGFVGNETRLADRDWRRHVTILSGDLLGDDGPGFANRADNTRRVVEITTTGALLDGFTIRGGNAVDDPSPAGGGGAIRVGAGQAVTVRHCRLIENEARNGGAVALDGSIRMENCVVAHNRATGVGLMAGGGVFVLIDVLHVKVVEMLNCLITGNEAGSGGGVYADHTNATLINCTVVGNHATNRDVGAGVILEGTLGQLTIANSILWANVGTAGADSDLAQLWTPNAPSFLELNHSNIQAYAGSISTGGTGNVGFDPLFVDELGTDGLPATGDEDYRLAGGSPLIDRGDATALDPAIDTDLAGDPRVVDDPATVDTGPGAPPMIDLGAFEFGTAPIPAASTVGLLMLTTLLLIGGGVVLRTRRAENPKG